MRDRALKIGVAILALASLPSCATDPVDEADAESALGPAEPSTNEDVRSSVIVDDVITPLPSCGFNYLSYHHGWSYYGFRNCSAVDTIRRQVVEDNGSTGPCFVLPPGTSVKDHIYGLIVDRQAC